jgi:sugar fermentation stimulation protein A
MQEILLPGTEVLLEKADSPSRATEYTFVAAVHNGEIVALHSTRTNRIASGLILPALFDKPLRVRQEITYGSSRFDFEVKTDEGTTLVEVKSCTLCEYVVAMFPDAPYARAVRHVMELLELVQKREVTAGLVLFIIGHPGPEVFIPNIHTDPVFSRALLQASGLVSIRACSVSASEDGIVETTALHVPVDLRPVRLVDEDRGVYLIALFLNSPKCVATGGLGEIEYPRGWYVYVGSAKRGLSARMRRHLSNRKTCRWHIDYLSLAADSRRAYPIYTDRDVECELATQIEAAGGLGIPGFGCSDCSCKTHLFRFTEDPFSIRRFVDLLFFYRHKGGITSYVDNPISRREH